MARGIFLLTGNKWPVTAASSVVTLSSKVRTYDSAPCLLPKSFKIIQSSQNRVLASRLSTLQSGSKLRRFCGFLAGACSRCPGGGDGSQLPSLTCPHCGFTKRATMPAEACQFYYECDNCKRVLRPNPGGRKPQRRFIDQRLEVTFMPHPKDKVLPGSATPEPSS